MLKRVENEDVVWAKRECHYTVEKVNNLKTGYKVKPLSFDHYEEIIGLFEFKDEKYIVYRLNFKDVGVAERYRDYLTRLNKNASAMCHFEILE